MNQGTLNEIITEHPVSCARSIVERETDLLNSGDADEELRENGGTVDSGPASIRLDAHVGKDS